ncbi:MAG: alpha-D-ribose 1-methylphosphonate 5-triphosphate diphosphatase [Sarcina sp.]
MRYIIKNGIVITESDLLFNKGIIVNLDRIEKIVDESYTEEGLEEIDARGGYISPGFIDLHSDYIETMACPRPTSMMDFRLGLLETERVLATTGITTMYHSLSLIKDDEFSTKPIRESANVKKLLSVIDNCGVNLIRNKFHARLEIDNVEQVDELREYIKERKIQLLSIMDHSPGQGQYTNLEIYRKTLKGYRKNITDQEIDSILDNHKQKEKLTFDKIKDLIEFSKENNVAVASHDDDTKEKIDLIKDLNVEISEFPIKMEVAKYARERGMYTIAGAPNVILGGSHSGNLSAAEGIVKGNINILCSDYYPQGMLHSVFLLSDKYDLSLVEAVKLVTLNPAKAAKIDKELGSIKEGKKADLLIINRPRSGMPVISKTIVNGEIISSFKALEV